MTFDEIINSNAYIAVSETIQKIPSLLPLEPDKLLYLEMTKFLISKIPESVPDNIVSHSLNLIKVLLDKTLGSKNTNLVDAIHLFEETKNDTINKDAQSNWIQQCNPQQLNISRQQYLKANPNKTDFEDWFWNTQVVIPRTKSLSDLIENALQQYNNGIKQISMELAFIFSVPYTRSIEQELQQLERLKEKTNDALQQIEKRKEESVKLISYIAGGTIEGHYAKQAETEQCASRRWMIASICSTLSAIGWLVYSIFHCVQLYNNIDIKIDSYRFLLYFIPRGSLTLCILGLAVYFGKQAIYRRNSADFLRKRAFALQAISPFLDDIAKEKPEALVNSKQKVVESLIQDGFK